MSDLISREALLEALEQSLNADRYISVRDIIKNATAIEQGEPFGYFKAEPFGWTDCAETDEGAIALYEAPQQPQSVADALEEAAKICVEISAEHNDPFQSMRCANAIRALIKRNADGVE